MSNQNTRQPSDTGFVSWTYMAVGQNSLFEKTRSKQIYTILPCYGYSTQFQECLTWTDPCPYPRKLCCCSLKPCLAPREEHIHFMDTPLWLKHSEPPRDAGHVAIFAFEHLLTIQFIPILEYIIHVMPYPGQFLAWQLIIFVNSKAHLCGLNDVKFIQI